MYKHLRYMEAYPHEVFHQNCKSFKMNPLSLIYQLKLMIVSGYLKTLHLNQYVDVYFQIQYPWPHFQTPDLKTHSGNDLKLYIDGRLLWVSKINNLISQLALSKVIENTLFVDNSVVNLIVIRMYENTKCNIRGAMWIWNCLSYHYCESILGVLCL